MGDLWSGENGKRISRRVARFKVRPSLPISIFIPQSKKKTFSAVTFSPRGLGFFGAKDDAQLSAQKNVDIRLKVDKFSIDLKANIRYCTPVKNESGTTQLNYVGLQFLNVKPLLTHLLEDFIVDRLKKGQLVLS